MKPNRPPYIPHLWEEVKCPFCGSDNHKLYEKFGHKLEFTYVRCTNCSLVYETPRPKYDEIFLHAAYDHYHVYNPSYTYRQEILKEWKKEVAEIVKFDRQRSSLLDIGAAMGEFLAVAMEYYNECTGLDVARNMADFVEQKLKLKVIVGKFEELSIDKKYSCIHMSHVIEHVPNPKEWIQKAKKLLLPGGILALSVPNMFSLDRRIKLFFKRTGLRKGAWKEDWKTPDHLYVPTIHSILMFFRANGFKVLSYYTYSRKNMDAKNFSGRIFNRWLKLGTNMRFFVTPVEID